MAEKITLQFPTKHSWKKREGEVESYVPVAEAEKKEETVPQEYK